MSTLHKLSLSQQPRKQPGKVESEGEVVAMPFIHLDTVLKTMQMLREFPDQTVLDEFNRTSSEP